MSSLQHVLGLFPGQGSQRVGMGQEFYASSSIAKELFAAADEVLGFSLSEICFNGPEDKLTATELVQPAILTVSTICYRMAKAALGDNLVLAAAAGHSLGEYSALVAAEALDFREAVLLVHKRGRYMQAAVPLGMGKMLAVLGMEQADLEAALAKVTGLVQIANLNSSSQIVVSGEASAINELRNILADIKVVELAVSAPFHCELMAPAAAQLSLDLDKLNIQPAAFPVYANYSAKALTRPDEIREALKLQVCGRVRWSESMQNAIKNVKPELAIEFGGGNVLSGLMRRINKGLKCSSVSSFENLEKLTA